MGGSIAKLFSYFWGPQEARILVRLAHLARENLIA